MTRRYRVPDRLAVVEGDQTTYLAPVPQGPIFALEGSAADIWGLAPGTPVETLAQVVAGHFEIAVDEVDHEVVAIAQSLVEQGLLVETDEP